jgi:hypothetical protein
MAIVVVSASDVARADAAGDTGLATVEAAINKAKTNYFEFDVTNGEPGKPDKTSGFTVRSKGEKVFQEWVAPADMKGTKLLVVSPTEIYVFLPSFGKVRRIASTTKDQGFMGMTFTTNDLWVSKWSDKYAAVVTSDSPKDQKLTLTPKAGQTTDWSKIEMTLTKDHNVPTELKYYDAKGVNVKTETRTGYTCTGDVCTPGERKMVDNTKAGAWTKLVRKTWKVNENISDDVFTKKNLGE